MPSQDTERIHPANAGDWRAWLIENHDRSNGVWLVAFKKSSGKPTLSWDEAVSQALCFGWIDSVRNTVDDERYAQFFSPRRRKSPWSKINKAKVERLIADGLMTPAGLAKIEQAKRDGTWELSDAIEALTVPDDLAVALSADAAAEATFRTFSPSETKQLLWHLASAKRPETRTKRIAEIVEAAANGFNPLNWNVKKRRERESSTNQTE